jgi:arabinogalactan oligomer/maltooligosaccharide transport system substrate-binding protein
MKRILVVLASLVIAGSMLLAACTPAATPTSAPATSAPATSAPATEVPTAEVPTEPPAPVTVNIWHQWSGGYLDAITAAFDQYSTDHPNVTIDLSKPDDVTSALAVAIPAGEGPDIIAWANDQIGTLALKGQIVALDDYGITQDWLKATYEPAAVAGVIWQGKIWALPESQEAITLVYNKAISSPSDFPTDPLDFAGLLADAKAYQEKNPDKTLFCNQGFAGGDAYHIAPVYFGFGVPQYVDDQGNVTVNTPEAVAAGQWLVDIKPYLLPEQTADLCKADFIAGKVAAMWTGPWNIADFDTAGIQYGFIPMGKPFVGIKTLMVTANAVQRGQADLSVDIIKYYTGFDAQKAITLANKTIPANTAVMNDPEVQALTTIAGFGANANLGIPMANTPFAGAQWGPVGDATAAIWSGSQTPAEALAAAQTAIETAVAGMK